MNNKLYKKGKEFIKEILKFIKINVYFILLFVFFIVCLTVKLPWSVYAPGGLINIEKRLEGQTFKGKGSFNLTYVTFVEGTIPSLFLSFILPEWDIVSNEEITLKGEDIKIANKRDKIAMEESLSNATYVAYTKALKEINVKKFRLHILYLSEEANSTLCVGDEILSYDGINVDTYEKLTKYIESKEVGDKIKFIVKRDGEKKEATATIILLQNEKKIGISISNIKDYNVFPSITYTHKKSESGSSGGLMLSLSLYNALVEKDITKGLKISGTGTIDSDGNVGEIAGVKYKLSGAVKKKSDVFLVPTENYKEALEVKEKHHYKITIIEAKTFDQVLEELRKL